MNNDFAKPGEALPAAKTYIPDDIVDAMSIDDTSTPEEVLRAIHVADLLAEKVKALREHYDAGLLEWLLRYGEIEDGPIRYYVGSSKRTACRDKPATLNKLFDLCEGSFERVCEYFAASPFKYGSVKDLMDDPSLFDEHFEQIPITDVRTGKVRKKVKKTDTTFHKKGQK